MRTRALVLLVLVSGCSGGGDDPRLAPVLAGAVEDQGVAESLAIIGANKIEADAVPPPSNIPEAPLLLLAEKLSARAGEVITVDAKVELGESATLHALYMKLGGARTAFRIQPETTTGKAQQDVPIRLALDGARPGKEVCVELRAQDDADLVSQPRGLCFDISAAPAPNKRPVVDAGASGSGAPGELARLVGTARDADGDGLSLFWRQTAGTDLGLGSAAGAILQFVVPSLPATETVQLQFGAIDSRGALATDTVSFTIEVPNRAPVFRSVSGEQIVAARQSVTLTATAEDPDGPDPVISWRQLRGVPVVLSKATTSDISFVAPETASQSALVFEAVARDSEGAAVKRSVIVRVDPPPPDSPPAPDADGDGVPDATDFCPNSRGAVDAQGCAADQRDSDGDGVSDASDQCAGSPAGASVDAAGCTAAQRNVDADGDGVRDEIDQCPATPSGESANSSGCSASQRDGDNDGVSDSADACGGTAAGASVDAAGCSAAQRDADGDGIPNSADQCAQTSAGSTVDARGCAASQRDSDADGVTDNLDQCPGTAVGRAVDARGCSAAQRDTDGDGVSDANDACPGTAAGATVDGRGCAASQTDTDQDGVPDSVDSCPNSTGAVDASGCSAAQRDGDGDGVSDANDACPNTAANTAVGADGCDAAAPPPPTHQDSDGDGFDDSRDSCPGTPSGLAVNSAGCSAGQLGTPGSWDGNDWDDAVWEP